MLCGLSSKIAYGGLLDIEPKLHDFEAEKAIVRSALNSSGLDGSRTHSVAHAWLAITTVRRIV